MRSFLGVPVSCCAAPRLREPLPDGEARRRRLHATRTRKSSICSPPRPPWRSRTLACTSRPPAGCDSSSRWTEIGHALVGRSRAPADARADLPARPRAVGARTVFVALPGPTATCGSRPPRRPRRRWRAVGLAVSPTQVEERRGSRKRRTFQASTPLDRRSRDRPRDLAPLLGAHAPARADSGPLRAALVRDARSA